MFNVNFTFTIICRFVVDLNYRLSLIHNLAVVFRSLSTAVGRVLVNDEREERKYI